MADNHQNAPAQAQDGPELNEVIVDLDPSDETSNKLRRRLLLRRFWQSARSFWGVARGRRRSWALSGIVLFLILLSLAASYGMNLWNRAIFDALEQHDASSVLVISLIYFPL